MPKRSSKLPRDPNQLAAHIVAMSTGEETKVGKVALAVESSAPEKNQAAVALGRLGGLKGGKARAEKLTPEERTAIAKSAASKRWSKAGDGQKG